MKNEHVHAGHNTKFTKKSAISLIGVDMKIQHAFIFKQSTCTVTYSRQKQFSYEMELNQMNTNLQTQHEHITE